MLFSTAAFSQMPTIEPGVSLELAKWRAANYSDVRYKLNLTLEKMSPVLKGTMEIRVNVQPGTQAPSPATPQGGVGVPIILDWRKIKGFEERSTISNLTLNGTPAIQRASFSSALAGPRTSPGNAVRDESRTLSYLEHDEHLVFRDGVVAGENVIKLDFTSPILPSGSAITRYVDKEDGAEYIYSLFVPSDASTAFPVFDQPDIKAKFTLAVQTEGTISDWKVVSNEVSSGKSILGGEFHSGSQKPGVIHRFRETKPISTYVFAFTAGDFKVFSESDFSKELTSYRAPRKLLKSRFARDVDPKASQNVINLYEAEEGVQIFVRKSQAAKFKPHAAEVFRLNREAVKYFEEYFDYKFPWLKYDLVLIPEFPFGGMEHAGATFLRESSVIFPQEPTRNDHINRATLIFHEAAHQWFGDTVTMRWFDDLWLKEGFATFTAYKALEKIMPEMNAWKVFYERVKQGAYQTDSTRGTTPIYQEIPNLSAAKSAYGNIVYNKAPAFLRQAEFYLGEDKFRSAVRSFLKKHEFGNAGWEDLVGEFTIASGNDPDTMKLWAEQWVTQRGLPVIRAGYSYGSKNEIFSYGLSQKAIPDSNVGEIKRSWRLFFNLYAKFPNGRTEIKRQFLDFEGEEPWRNDLGNQPIPNFVFPNYKDYGYGIFLLDEKSREYVLKNIQNEKDPFLRTMMWGALWDSVREAELDPREYVELVVKVLSKSNAFTRESAGGEASRPGRTRSNSGAITPEGVTLTEGVTLMEDESTTALLLSRVGTALNYYIDEPAMRRPDRDGGHNGQAGSKAIDNARASAGDLRLRVEDMLIAGMRGAETQGQRITYYRAFLNVAGSEKARGVLKDMLKSADAGRPLTTPSAEAAATPPLEGGEPEKTPGKGAGVPLKTKDKFDIVTRLLILGDPEAPKLLADLEKSETSDEAKRYAYAARAGIGTAENKAKYWKDFTQNKEISESWIEAAFGPWNSIRHSELTFGYLERALKELPNHKRNRKIFFVNGWLGAFIGGQRSEEALAIVNKFLTDNPNVDRDLRMKILENVDLIERAVKIRRKHDR